MEPCGARARSNAYVADGCVVTRIADDRLTGAPSGPAVMKLGVAEVVASANSVMTPAGVIISILLTPASVNQRFPSGSLLELRGGHGCVEDL
jgi:hypothetical protein